MFASLTRNLTKVFNYLKSSGTLSAAQIELAMRDIRIALLEADVALPVVRDFIAAVKVKALGQQVIKSVTPGQMIVKIIHDEIINILASTKVDTALQLASPPNNILIVGLQGSGKTTLSAKLALKLNKQNKKVLLVSLDTYRPAAQEQLAILAASIEVDCLPIVDKQQPIDITKRAIDQAKLGYDIVIYDTAGRLHIDDLMLGELGQIKSLIMPIETILVVDAMIGQDAVSVASNFDHKLHLTGVILSRVDGDARGGAALSIKHVTNKPIKFLSSGEQLLTLEAFDAKRLASRILGMGDIVSFVEQAASAIEHAEVAQTALKIQKGKFDFDDYLGQIRSIKKLGGIGKIFSMLPSISNLKHKLAQTNMNEKLLSHQEAIILSMSKVERKNPELLNGSRKKRIAQGSGTTIQQVNILLKQFKQLSTVMKKASQLDQKSLMRSGLGKLLS